jgi:hypothetical protein
VIQLSNPTIVLFNGVIEILNKTNGTASGSLINTMLFNLGVRSINQVGDLLGGVDGGAGNAGICCQLIHHQVEVRLVIVESCDNVASGGTNGTDELAVSGADVSGQSVERAVVGVGDCSVGIELGEDEVKLGK